MNDIYLSCLISSAPFHLNIQGIYSAKHHLLRRDFDGNKNTHFLVPDYTYFQDAFMIRFLTFGNIRHFEITRILRGVILHFTITVWISKVCTSLRLDTRTRAMLLSLWVYEL